MTVACVNSLLRIMQGINMKHASYKHVLGCTIVATTNIPGKRGSTRYIALPIAGMHFPVFGGEHKQHQGFERVPL